MSEQPRLEGIMEHWVVDSVYFFPLMGPCNNFYRNFVTDFFEKKHMWILNKQLFCGYIIKNSYFMNK